MDFLSLTDGALAHAESLARASVPDAYGIELLDATGSSGSTVCRMESPSVGPFVTKCVWSSANEALAREWRALQEWRVHWAPKPLDLVHTPEGSALLLTDMGGSTAARLWELGDARRAGEIWGQATICVSKLWRCEKTMGKPGRPIAPRLQRIHNHLSSARLLDIAIETEGLAPFRLDEAFSHLCTLRDPSIGVRCHGDPTPMNVVIDEESGSWGMVDWEWASSNSDVRVSLAAMVGGWIKYAIPRSLGPEYVAQVGRSIQLPADAIEQLDVPKTPLNLPLGVCSGHWTEVVMLIGLLLLGEIRFLNRRNAHPWLPAFVGLGALLARGSKDTLPLEKVLLEV